MRLIFSSSILRSDFDLRIVLTATAFLNLGSFFFFSKKDLVLEKIPSEPTTMSTRSFVLSSNLISTLPFSSETSFIFFQILSVEYKLHLLKTLSKLIFVMSYIYSELY